MGESESDKFGDLMIVGLLNQRGCPKPEELKVMKDTKLYYHMKDIRYILDIPDSTIRFWCAQFGIEPKRNKKGNRIFVIKEVEKLIEINRLLKVERYTIEGAKLQLA